MVQAKWDQKPVKECIDTCSNSTHSDKCFA